MHAYYRGLLQRLALAENQDVVKISSYYKLYRLLQTVIFHQQYSLHTHSHSYQDFVEKHAFYFMPYI